MKFIAYILVAAGIIVSAISKVIPLRDKILAALKFLPADGVIKYGLFVGVGLVVLGLIVLILGRESTPTEIPIYHGNKIVGYRRH